MKIITVKLISLVPFMLSESDGDELFIKHKGEKIWPSSKKFQRVKKERQDLGVTISLPLTNSLLDFELWERDFLSKDCLGVFRILADEKGGPFEASLVGMNGINCNYLLQWEVV